MRVVRVRHLDMPVPLGLVAVLMTVLARWHGLVHVRVMAVVVRERLGLLAVQKHRPQAKISPASSVSKVRPGKGRAPSRLEARVSANPVILPTWITAESGRWASAGAHRR